MKENNKIAIIFFSIVFVVYAISNRGEGANWNYFVLLADSFLHGRLNILSPPSWLNELVLWKGLYYVVFPPMPAILLMPPVAIFGTTFYQPILSWFLGAASVAISFLVFIRLFNKKIALWTSILYGFGTIQWFHAEVGSAWYLAHIVSLFFLWLTLFELLTKCRFFILGLLLGGAYLSRITTVFALFFILIYMHDEFFIINKLSVKIYWKKWLLFGLGLAPSVLLNGLYNYFRYGVFSDIGYTLLPIFNEPWYKYGLINIRYIPTHLVEMLTAMPIFINKPPFIIPSMFAMAVWFTTPAFILILFTRFKTKLSIAALTSLIAIALPSLIHGGNGFTQFGYRHTLDYMPFLLLLTAIGMENKVTVWTRLLILISVLVNLWGVIMISFLNIYIL